jgi:hypothetical protein
MSGWIGVDFDGTLATYGTWAGAGHVGEPIAPMVERVKRWLAEGHEVRIFTARIHPLDRCIAPEEVLAVPVVMANRIDEAKLAVMVIRAFCHRHFGRALPVTNVKDYGMVELWDDRAVQVRPNTGIAVGQSTRGLD